MTDKANGIARPERRGREPKVMILSLLGFVLFWLLLAQIKADPELLPGPLAVWQVIRSEALAGDLAHHMGATLRRVALAFGLAMGLGCVLGLILGLWPRLNQWLDPWVMVFLNIPALVVIVLCYLWIGLNETAAITAVAINKTAMVAVTIREGVRVLDRDLTDMARVYRLSPFTRLAHIIGPQLAPYLLTSIRNGLAIIWKIVLVVEFLGRSDGVGFQIHLYFQLFDIAHVLAYALSFVAVMLVIEFALVHPLEARAQEWRRRSYS